MHLSGREQHLARIVLPARGGTYFALDNDQKSRGVYYQMGFKAIVVRPTRIGILLNYMYQYSGTSYDMVVAILDVTFTKGCSYTTLC